MIGDSIMTIQDMEILIECKRLVEKMLSEKKYILERLEESGKGDTQSTRCVVAQIIRMERALEGRPPVAFYDQCGREWSFINE